MAIHNAPRQLFPAVSVIIPMYNVEKYVGDCLDSLLAQTFQDFEVIVVDDCSTDNSTAIVEIYAEKFGGRLTLTHMKKNSGGAGFPRNKGIQFARGEYISFIDPDDAFIATALEELYTFAKKFDVDVVQCEKNMTQLLRNQIKALTGGTKYICEVLNEHPFFSIRLELRYIVLNMFIQSLLDDLNPIYEQIPPHALDEFLHKEFDNEDSTALMSFIFSLTNIQRLQILQMQYQFNEFAAQAQARIDELEAQLKYKAPEFFVALNEQRDINAANIQKFNQFAVQAQGRIAELEAQLKSVRK